MEEKEAESSDTKEEDFSDFIDSEMEVDSLPPTPGKEYEYVRGQIYFLLVSFTVKVSLTFWVRPYWNIWQRIWIYRRDFIHEILFMYLVEKKKKSRDLIALKTLFFFREMFIFKQKEIMQNIKEKVALSMN
jgi:hypothetical protein